MCIAAAIVGGSVVGAIGSNLAAGKQASASQNAANVQQSMFNTQNQNLAPFRQAGGGAVGELGNLLGTSGNTTAAGYGSLNQPFTTANFRQLSPAYNFQLQQGAQGTLNQDAGAQGAMSGAALKDLQSYNQNFANTSFNNAFNQYQTQQNNVFSRLNSLAGIGESAASNQATGASSFGQGIGQSLTNVGTAQAGGIAGAANNLGSGALLGALYGGQGGSNMYDPYANLSQAQPGYQTPQVGAVP